MNTCNEEEEKFLGACANQEINSDDEKFKTFLINSSVLQARLFQSTLKDRMKRIFSFTMQPYNTTLGVMQAVVNTAIERMKSVYKYLSMVSSTATPYKMRFVVSVVAVTTFTIAMVVYGTYFLLRRNASNFAGPKLLSLRPLGNFFFAKANG
jgi:hypothetical protein